MAHFFKRHKETLLVGIVGLLVIASLNVMMLHYNYDVWTNPRVGFWSAFYKRFEISGFDPNTYITISKWRPLYVISRHPILSCMLWPLSQLNGWLMEELHINCSIFIVAIVWTCLGLASWLLTFRIMRRAIGLSFTASSLLTAWFFSFSHVMLVLFTPDHMSITLPLLLLTLYLAMKAIKRRKPMPLWQSLPLLFISTGVTTTNMVKVALADFFTQWGRKSFGRIMLHFLICLIPFGILGGLYAYQQNTTEKEEQAATLQLMQKKAARDPKFAAEWERSKAGRQKVKENQIIHFSFVTNTEHHIDRLPSLVENIFGEGFILHTDYTLKDANKNRPAFVMYRHWWYYAMEVTMVLLFLLGIWYGRRERLMWMTLCMFVFDMLLHVGLEFANADVYIMTAHWAFVIPIAVGYILKNTERNVRPVYISVLCIVSFLSLFLWIHNARLIIKYILNI